MQLMEADMDHSRTKSASSKYPALAEEFCKGESLKLNTAHNHYSAVSTNVFLTWTNLNSILLTWIQPLHQLNSLFKVRYVPQRTFLGYTCMKNFKLSRKKI